MPAIVAFKQLPALMTMAPQAALRKAGKDAEAAKLKAGAEKKGSLIGKVERFAQGGACLGSWDAYKKVGDQSGVSFEKGPLDSIKVLDMSTMLAGPLATQLFADQVWVAVSVAYRCQRLAYSCAVAAGCLRPL